MVVKAILGRTFIEARLEKKRKVPGQFILGCETWKEKVTTRQDSSSKRGTYLVTSLALLIIVSALKGSTLYRPALVLHKVPSDNV